MFCEIGSEDNYLIIVHENIPIITDIFLRPMKRPLANFTETFKYGHQSVVRRYCMQLKQALRIMKVNTIKN